MSKTIGSTTTYVGEGQPRLRSHAVKIVAVLKGRADPGADVDGEDAYITDDEHLARVGGVTAHDRIEVTPWIEQKGRWSFATSDPLAVELRLFEHLKTAD